MVPANHVRIFWTTEEENFRSHESRHDVIIRGRKKETFRLHLKVLELHDAMSLSEDSYQYDVMAMDLVLKVFWQDLHD